MKRLGAHLTKSGADFSLLSRHASQVTLLLFDLPDDDLPAAELELQREGNLWKISVPDIKAGQLYLYKVTGTAPEGLPDRFNGNNWLLDPCATAIHWNRRWGERAGLAKGKPIPQNRRFPKCVVTDPHFNWGHDAAPNIPLRKTVIYETHVRGFTENGTYADLAGKIAYLKSLGINAVELLPVFEFNEMEFLTEGGARSDLRNYWGYSTLGFFAPMSRYARSAAPGAAVEEFKEMVKTMHRAGIEVILDVVFNHTGEGPAGAQTLNFRGIDDPVYYLQNGAGEYMNFSGCGNTFNANHPDVIRFIVSCLEYWVEVMHIDGFRFDLATALTRGPDGSLLEDPPLIRAIENSRILHKTKLIAEAWDAAGAYQVGSFPSRRFAEWNGRFRDDVRRFWLGERGSLSGLATRLCGSDDLYHRENALKSINFVTCHDGFTLADLVSYTQKHNEANGEENRDGENHNYSCNFGAEGPTDDPLIRAARLRQMKNLMATLFVSRGIPMFPAGDEFARTQQGNNNAYCQDNERSWLDWSLKERNTELFEFMQNLIRFRAAHPELRRSTFMRPEWIGPDGKEPDWHHGLALGFIVRKRLAILINNENEPQIFRLPHGHWKLNWETGKSEKAGTAIMIDPRSICCYGRTSSAIHFRKS